MTNLHSPFTDISIIVITLNEEKDLPRCLRSIPAGCELIVVDSHSRDRTEEIARSFGAQFYWRAFTNYSEQKNAALAYATRSWVLALDADEELSPELCTQLVAIAKGAPPTDTVGFRLRRRLQFMGQRLRFGQTTDYPLRFFRRTYGTYINPIHEQVIVTGKVARLRYDLLHDSYADLSDYFAKFNRYTTQAAAAGYTQKRRKPRAGLLIVRPFFAFVQRYILRLGFLDGYAGYCHALLASMYVFTKYAKLRERYQQALCEK